MGQAVSYILNYEERSNEQNLQTISRPVSPPSSLSCNYSSSVHNNAVKHRFKVDHSSVQVVDNDKAQNSGINSSNIDPNTSSSSTGGTLLHEVFSNPSIDVPSINSSNDQALVHEPFVDHSSIQVVDNDKAQNSGIYSSNIDPSTSSSSTGGTLLHEPFVDHSIDVPSIDSSNDQALVHEPFVDHSIDVPSIDSSNDQALVHEPFVDHSSIQVVDNDKAQNSGINSSNIDPNTSSSSTGGTLLHEVFSNPSIDVPSIDSSNDQALVHEPFVYHSSIQVVDNDKAQNSGINSSNIDPNTSSSSTGGTLLHEPFVDHSIDVPSIDSSNDQALVHEQFFDHSIDVPSIDSSNDQALVHEPFVDHSSIQVVDNDKAQNSGINSSNIDPNTSSSSTGGTLLHEPFVDHSIDVPSIDSSNDQALVHEQFVDHSINVPSIDSSNDQALVHEPFVDHSIDVPRIDSSTYEEFLSKLIYAFQIHDQFKVTDSNTQVVEDKSQVPWPNNSSNSNKRRKSKRAKPRKEAAVVIERKIKHYRSSQKILLVGEGDFSFSACLARAFGSASNIVATSLDSTEFLFANYQKAHSNISELMSRGAKVYHGVDATEMACNDSLNHLIFDRIIFNFPLAGFFLNASEKTRLKRNRGLIVKFFENAMELISEDGEIHIAHKSCGFFLKWNLPLLASNVGLRLIEEVPFHLRNYKGYNNKYGFGGDKNFDCEPSKTYKFGF